MNVLAKQEKVSFLPVQEMFTGSSKARIVVGDDSSTVAVAPKRPVAPPGGACVIKTVHGEFMKYHKHRVQVTHSHSLGHANLRDGLPITEADRSCRTSQCCLVQKKSKPHQIKRIISFCKPHLYQDRGAILLVGMHIVLGQPFNGSFGLWGKAHMLEWMRWRRGG